MRKQHRGQIDTAGAVGIRQVDADGRQSDVIQDQSQLFARDRALLNVSGGPMNLRLGPAALVALLLLPSAMAAEPRVGGSITFNGDDLGCTTYEIQLERLAALESRNEEQFSKLSNVSCKRLSGDFPILEILLKELSF